MITVLHPSHFPASAPVEDPHANRAAGLAALLEAAARAEARHLDPAPNPEEESD